MESENTRLLNLCFRNLFRRRVRTLLAISGITLATMFIVAIGATTSRYVTVLKEMNVFFSGDIVAVWKGTPVIQGFPIGGFFPESIVGRIKNVNITKAATPMFFVFNLELGGGISPLPSNVSIGVPTGNWSVLVGPTPLNKGGSWPSVGFKVKEAVVGSSLAQQYALVVGSEIDVKGYKLRVTGILETGSGLLSRAIIMPLDVSQDVYAWPMMINMVVVEPKDGVTEKELATRIQSEVSTLNAWTEQQRNDLLGPLLSEVEMFNVGIRSVLFFMSMVLVTTVAMMNVSERRRDFATLDAIGAPKTYVARMVMIETALMGFFGGAAGILLGAVTALLMASIYTSIPLLLFFPSFFDIVPPWLMIEILALTVVVSCVAGVIPALSAAKTKITEFLRSEY